MRRYWAELPAGDFDYDSHDADYAGHRRTEPAIEREVHGALGDGGSVLNVGAGSGSYEPADRYVVAVEPSASMRSQRPAGRVPAVNAIAESLPFDDDTFDAAMAMVTVHQWRDTDAGLREMRRVTRGPVVVLTFDPDALAGFWLAEYTGDMLRREAARFPAMDRICDVLGGGCDVRSVPIPFACADGFVAAFYGRPESLLDEEVRDAQSCWHNVSAAANVEAMSRLAADLDSGEWDRRHGALRTQPTFNGSLRLVVAQP